MRRIVLLSELVVVAVLMSCGGDDDASTPDASTDGGPTRTDAGPGGAHVEVPDQMLELSTIIALGVVSSSAGNVVLIREDSSGVPGAVLGGFDVVMDGDTAGASVVLDRPTRNNEGLYASVHADVASVDDPLSAVVMFTVTHGAATVDVRIHVSNVSSFAWEVTSVDPESYASGIVGTEMGSPTLTLRAGWKYGIDNPARMGHPFEMLTDGEAGLPGDVVQLSQSEAAPLEPMAGWEEDGNEARFTVTPEMMAVVDTYRCGVHSATMRGAVQYRSD